jgi:hypothetical protein
MLYPFKYETCQSKLSYNNCKQYKLQPDLIVILVPYSIVFVLSLFLGILASNGTVSTQPEGPQPSPAVVEVIIRFKL